jgi:anti-anti-sigma factor
MERHLTTSTGATSTRNEGSTTAIGVIRAEAAFNRNTAFDSNKRAWPARREPHPGSESVSVWMHTLILTGELTHGSAHTLEVEIERLFKEGVTGITLDLRQLTYIDPIGVGVIAFRSRLCRRQGHSFVLIPGPRSIQRAFEQAGVIDWLPFQEDEVAARRQHRCDPVPGCIHEGDERRC